MKCPCVRDDQLLLPVIRSDGRRNNAYDFFVEIKRRNEYVTQLWYLTAKVQTYSKYSSTKIRV